MEDVEQEVVVPGGALDLARVEPLSGLARSRLRAKRRRRARFSGPWSSGCGTGPRPWPYRAPSADGSRSASASGQSRRTAAPSGAGRQVVAGGDGRLTVALRGGGDLADGLEPRPGVRLGEPRKTGEGDVVDDLGATFSIRPWSPSVTSQRCPLAGRPDRRAARGRPRAASAGCLFNPRT